MQHGSVQIIEAIACAHTIDHRLIGCRVDHIPLPSVALIGAVVREGEVILPDENVVIEPEDHLLFCVTRRTHVAQI